MGEGGNGQQLQGSGVRGQRTDWFDTLDTGWSLKSPLVAGVPDMDSECTSNLGEASLVTVLARLTEENV